MLKTWRMKSASFLLVLTLLLGLCAPAMAAVSDQGLSAAIADTAAYLCKVVKSPQTGSLGGDWVVLGLSRNGYAVPEDYYEDYYASLEESVKACGGVLHKKKYTEYSRTIIAVTAIGKDARDVAGHDLTLPLGDFDQTVWQGINGPIWALIALDSGDYPMPVNSTAKTQATRQMYVDEILSRQLDDGGWNLTAKGGSSAADSDITGMALQALAGYLDQPKVQAAVDRAVDCMSRQQDADGGFSTMITTGEELTATSESSAQMVTGLAAVGIDPDTDERFIKNGHSLLDALMSYRTTDGGFAHIKGVGVNQMATEQGFYALVAVQRLRQQQNRLYDMSDAISIGASTHKPGEGLPGKHKDVQSMPIIAPGTTFDDLATEYSHPNQFAIEGLAARGIINGIGNGQFAPDRSMSRAEFAAIVVKALGLTPKANDSFSDVKAADWFAPYVGTASDYGIINGIGDGKFDPYGTITRQEAAVMVARAAKLCGMETELDNAAVRDALAQFADYVKADAWARPGLAFCYSAGLLDDSALEIQPKTPILRCEIAQIVYNLLGAARLL